MLFHLSLPWYELGWDWETLTYDGFWTPTGFLRNLFFNGWHPVFPWFAFIAVGMLIGRADLGDSKARLRIALAGLSVFVLFEALSYTGLYIAAASGADTGPESDARALLGTAPLPPSLFYVATAAGAAAAFLMASLEAAARLGPRLPLVGWGAITGRHLLTHYVLHVLLLLGLLALWQDNTPSLAVLYSVVAANFIAATVLSLIWNRFFPLGPLEFLMRRLCG